MACNAGGMLITSISWYQRRTNAAARLLFRGSLLYLPLFMGGLLFHRVPNTEANREKVAQRLQAPLSWLLPASGDGSLAVSATSAAALEPTDMRRQPPGYHSIALAPFPFLPCPSAMVYTERYEAPKVSKTSDSA